VASGAGLRSPSAGWSLTRPAPPARTIRTIRTIRVTSDTSDTSVTNDIRTITTSDQLRKETRSWQT
jgi:hypothetical protein